MYFSFFVMELIISSRLNEINIYCMANEKLRECGRIKGICFDKTGTLTENDIKIFGYSLMEKGIL